MLGSNSSISYIVLCNYHSNTSCNHKNANRKEEPKEPLGIVTEIATIIFLCSVHGLSSVHQQTWN